MITTGDLPNSISVIGAKWHGGQGEKGHQRVPKEKGHDISSVKRYST